MRVCSLFSGVGMFDLAARQVGWEVVFANDNDKFAVKTYEANHPDVKIVENDINDIPDQWIPQHDILLAGFPCQSFSIAGNRKGVQDDRGQLFKQILRVIYWKRPDWILLENVPHLLKIDGGEVFRSICSSLEEMGYLIDHQILNAKDHTVPQSRKRLFIVCRRVGIHRTLFDKPIVWPKAVKLEKCLRDLLEPEVAEKYYIPKKQKLYLARQKVDKLHQIDGEIAIAQSARQYANWRGQFVSDRLIRVGHINKGRQGERIYSPNGIAETLKANAGGLGAKTGLYWINERVRKLTPRECARVMGLPDSFELPCSDSQSYKQMGNGVVVPLVKAILEEIKRA